MREVCSSSQLSPLALALAAPGESTDSANEAAGASTSSGNSACVVVLIPAYKPDRILINAVKAISKGDWAAVVVVDDGSGPAYSALFQELARLPNVDVVPLAVNLGKGSALKAGINFVLCAYPEVRGVVTADADGQHDPADICDVGKQFRQHPDSLVLGTRDFGGRVPIRSRFGNEVTRRAMRTLVGYNLADTQTGLRAIPAALLPRLLKVTATGYEFETEMLIAAKHLGLDLVQHPIRTIYEPGNPTSHFHPLRDSMRIYFVLLRFGLIGGLSAILDNLMFYVFYSASAHLLAAQLGARVIAAVFNYTAVRKAVFLSDQRHEVLLPRYLLLASVNTFLSYAGIRLLTGVFGASVFPAKLAAEALLFIANFVVQRDFVFTGRAPAPRKGEPACD